MSALIPRWCLYLKLICKKFEQKSKQLKAKTLTELCECVLTELSTCCTSATRDFQSFQWDFPPNPCKKHVMKQTHETETVHQETRRRFDETAFDLLTSDRTYSQFNLGISRQMSSSFVKELFSKTLSVRETRHNKGQRTFHQSESTHPSDLHSLSTPDCLIVSEDVTQNDNKMKHKVKTHNRTSEFSPEKVIEEIWWMLLFSRILQQQQQKKSSFILIWKTVIQEKRPRWRWMSVIKSQTNLLFQFELFMTKLDFPAEVNLNLHEVK